MTYKPLREPGDAGRSCAPRSRGPGQAPLPIDYSMEKTPEGWKAYGVVVAGVSRVTNYRDEFNDIVRSSGIDGLIKTLADKNNKGTPAK
jgi:phospholipid transport system substrate-binding protein